MSRKTIEFVGWEELAQFLREIEPDITRNPKEYVRVMKASMAPWTRRVKSRTGRKTGTLRKSVGSVTMKKRLGGKRKVAAGAFSGYLTKKRKAYHGYLYEHGSVFRRRVRHRWADRGKMPAASVIRDTPPSQDMTQSAEKGIARVHESRLKADMKKKLKRL